MQIFLGETINGVISESLVSSGIGFGYQQYDLVFQGPLIASNSFQVTVDGAPSTPVVFATSNAATLQAIKVQLLVDFPSIKQISISNQEGGYDTYKMRIVFNNYGAYKIPVTAALVTSGASQVQVVIEDKGGLTQLMLIGGSPLDVLLATRQDVDSGDATITYYGYALPGALDADPVWAIKRVTTVSAEITTEWADGIFANAFIWDDRETLTYS
jgi:hypothetical protein